MPSTLATEQVLALAMARHARLGAESTAKCLDADAFQVVWKWVHAAHQKLASTTRIVKICVKAGDIVDRIELHRSDGSFLSRGGDGGEWLLPATLEIGEYIIGVGGRKGGGLDAVYFTTNFGRAFNFAGRFNGGRIFHTPRIEPGFELSTLQTESPPGHDWLLDVVTYSQPSPWVSPMAKLLLAHPNRSVFEQSVTRPLFHRVGALYAGHDIDRRVCTFAEARERAMELPNCAGFTFNSAAPRFHGLMECFFKDVRGGNNDWRWQTWLKTEWTGADPPQSNWSGNAHEHAGAYHAFMHHDGDGDDVDNDDDESESDDDEEEDEEEDEHV